MAIDVALISGIIIIIVAVVTFLRILKPVLEGAIVIILIFIGSALIFHASPVIGLPHYGLPVNLGPNIVGVSPGIKNTTNVVVFNADPLSIGSFDININNKTVEILDPGLVIPPAKFGVIEINSSEHGEFILKASSQLFGFNLGTSSSSYNYT
ncbi:hypothetical protein M1293_01625 [Candidatus Parvarchaeota archaeon]|nr:hypothetical protein [Candidatus Parvarchaeota archaeon]